MPRDFNTAPLPLEAITLHPRHHTAALWWLGWLYRNPDAFRDSLKQLRRWPGIRAVVMLYLHALPWLLLLVLAGKMVLFEMGLVHPDWAQLTVAGRSLAALNEAGVGLLFGLAVGVGLALVGRLDFVLVFGLVFGPVIGLNGGLGGIAHGLSFGLGFGLAVGLILGLVGAFLGGLVNSRVFGFVVWLVFGLAVGLVFGLAVGLGVGLAGRSGGGLVGGLVGGSLFGLVLGLVSRLVVSLVGGPGVGVVLGIVVGLLGAFAGRLVFDLSVGLSLGLAGFAGFLVGYYRGYNICLHAPLLFLSRGPAFYRFHPAAWDWHCWTPFLWFDRLLVGYAELDPGRMEKEIQRLIREVPGQRSAALRALTILRARKAAQVAQLSQLSVVVADLPEGRKGYLAETRRVRELVEDIARQQSRLDETTRPYFREIEARSLVAEIRSFQGRVSGMKEPLATEFRKAADAWLKLAEAQVANAKEATQAEPAPLVFRAGDELAGEREAYVPRLRVLEELEGQIMLATGCPGVLLRAPRRMGKSSLFKNLAAFLPRDVAVVFKSLQSATLFSSTAHLVGGLSEAIERRLSTSSEFDSLRQSRQANPPADLAGFLRFLIDCNAALERTGRRLLVALDEYEMLDAKVCEGAFTRDLLATLRESIQSHRRVIWAFAGNKDITELTGADWTSYLISVRTLEVPLFTPDETRLLLTQPLKHSALQEEDKAKSALFWREFWGDDGITLIHAESGGWPYFVQLAAETAVMLANESAPGVKPLPSALLERVLEESVSRGRNAFIQLLQSQGREGSGEWEYLAKFARRETQPPPADAEVRRVLKRRQLLTETPDGEWRLVVPLMARWLRKET
jgi:hypothetical protein